MNWPPASRLANAFLLIACLAIGALVSVLWGQDINWDLRNYHIYNVSHFLRALHGGDYDRDLMAAGIQSTFNPTLDFPYSLLAQGPFANSPRLLAGFMGLWYGAVIYAALRIAQLLFAPFPRRALMMALALPAAVTGIAAFSQVGSTMNEMQMALLLLLGFLCIAHALGNDRARPVFYRIAAGGFLFGLAAGLKLSGIMYAPALCLSLLFLFSAPVWVRACVVFSAGWLAGFLISFGWWGFFVWQHFGSPTFPLFNTLFTSPLYPPENIMEERFFPHGLLQWLFYPFYWAFTASHAVAENNFRDPRFACAMLLLIVFAAHRLSGLRNKNALPRLTPPQKLAVAFTVTAYLFWLRSIAGIRYAITIEILAVLVSVVLLDYGARLLKTSRQALALPIAAACLSLLCLLTTRTIDWGHAPYGDRVYDINMGWVEPQTLFIAITGPSAYLAAFVPEEKQARFIGFNANLMLRANGWPVAEKARAIARNHQGPIIVLVPTGMTSLLGDLSFLGLTLSSNECRVIASNLDQRYGAPVLACPARILNPLVPSR